jgi:hypothetical protein
MPPGYQAILLAAICIHSSSHHQSFVKRSIEDLLLPVSGENQGPLEYLPMRSGDPQMGDTTPDSCFLSELNDTSRAEEFLLLKHISQTLQFTVRNSHSG